ncbi:MAG: hypothetical protein AAFR65_16155 [Pseudomonadota bacterium]
MAFYEYLPLGKTFKHWKGWASNANSSQATYEQVLAAWNSLTCSTAFVWEPYEGVGHASILVWEPTIDLVEYISTFPGGDGVGHSKRDAIKSLPVEWMGFAEDCNSESRVKGRYRIPEHIIPLPNLNHSAMLSRAADKQSASKDYHFLRRNCSTVAAGVLRAGLSYKTLARLSHYAYKRVWTPTEFYWFAAAVARHT